MTVSRYALLACAVGLLGHGAFASPITVTNFSFETLPSPPFVLNPGASGSSFTIASQNAIPGWTASSPANEGQYDPNAPGPFYNSVPDGVWVAYANAGNLTQTVAPLVAANTTYSLTVSLGLRTDFPVLGSAELLINGLPYLATGVTPTAGNWSTFTALYDSAAHPADVGHSITIELISNGVQAGFDDVILNATPDVPEPASMAFIGTGLLGLALLGWRNRSLA